MIPTIPRPALRRALHLVSYRSVTKTTSNLGASLEKYAVLRHLLLLAKTDVVLHLLLLLVKANVVLHLLLLAKANMVIHLRLLLAKANAVIHPPLLLGKGHAVPHLLLLLGKVGGELSPLDEIHFNTTQDNILLLYWLSITSLNIRKSNTMFSALESNGLICYHLLEVEKVEKETTILTTCLALNCIDEVGSALYLAAIRSKVSPNHY